MPSHVCLQGLTQLLGFFFFFSLGLCRCSFIIKRVRTCSSAFLLLRWDVLSFSLNHSHCCSLQWGAAAEGKGTQMSDIPSAALFSDPSHPACRESLLQSEDISGCKLAFTGYWSQIVYVSVVRALIKRSMFLFCPVC